MSQCDLLDENLSLHLTRRVVVVVIESTLPYGNHLGIGKQFSDPLDAMACVVRVDTSCCPNIVERARNLNRKLR